MSMCDGHLARNRGGGGDRGAGCGDSDALGLPGGLFVSSSSVRAGIGSETAVGMAGRRVATGITNDRDVGTTAHDGIGFGPADEFGATGTVVI